MKFSAQNKLCLRHPNLTFILMMSVRQTYTYLMAYFQGQPV